MHNRLHTNKLYYPKSHFAKQLCDLGHELM